MSHWNGELPKLEIWTNWAYSRRFDHLFGRLTYLGQPAYGFLSSSMGAPADSFGRNIYVDTSTRPTAPGWKRENSFLSHRGTGVFCYGLYPHDPYPGYPAVGRRPAGKGERYRATVVGPGVLPDVTWEGAAPGAYDEALDRQLAEHSARSTAPTPSASPSDPRTIAGACPRRRSSASSSTWTACWSTPSTSGTRCARR